LEVGLELVVYGLREPDQVQGLGVGVWGLGFGALGLGRGMWDVGCGMWGFGFWVECLVSRVSGSGFRVWCQEGARDRGEKGLSVYH
jgi:hypothetical protein